MGDQFFNPKSLKTLAFNVERSEGNNVLHQFVLDNSYPNNSGSEYYIQAVLMSMSDVSDELNKEGNSALILAVLKNNPLMVKKLLSCLKNIDVNTSGTVNSRRVSRNNALHFAAMLGHLSIVQELLNKGADVDRQNSEGKTALCFAAGSGDLDLVKLLVSKGANLNLGSGFSSPLLYAAKAGHLTTVECLLNSGAEIKDIDDGWTPLHSAAQAGNLRMLKLLLDRGKNINIKNGRGHTLFVCAVQSGDWETIDFLILQGAYTKGKDKQSADILSMKDKVKIILPTAVFAGKYELVEKLVNCEADLNAKYDNGDTILHYACAGSSRLDIIEILLKKGSDVNAKNELGRTALHTAVSNDNLDCSQLLLERGASVNLADNDGWTALHCAMYSSEDMIKLLVERKADVNAKNADGETPLHFAKENKMPKSIIKLLKRKAKNKDGKTPLDLDKRK